MCNGSAVFDWTVAAHANRIELAEAKINGERLSRRHAPADGLHALVVSGSVTWCAVCGAYGNNKALGLKKACPGRDEAAARAAAPSANLSASSANAITDSTSAAVLAASARAAPAAFAAATARV